MAIAKFCRASVCRTLIAVASLGCNAEIAPPSSGIAEQAPLPDGYAGLALRLAPGVDVVSARYAITRPDGFFRSGSMVLDGQSFSAQIALPAERDYTLQLEATSTSGTICTGDASFDVIVGQTTALMMTLRCPGAADLGGVDLHGGINVCPVLQAISAQPRRVRVGDVALLSATATDPDHAPQELAYAWTASSGQIADPSAASTTFTCAGIGASAATVVLSDGDDGCPQTSGAVEVICADGAGGASGNQAGASAGGAGAGEGGSTGSAGAVGAADYDAGQDDSDAGG